MDITIPEGTVILQEGEVSMDLYKIKKGSCEVYSGYGTNNESILGIISKGTYFGEIGFFSQKPAIITVVAYSDVVLERIIMGEFEDYVREHYDDVLSIMKNMTDTMYNLKFNMNLLIEDLGGKTEKVNREALEDTYIRDQFKKYRLMGMHSLSFFSAKA